MTELPILLIARRLTSPLCRAAETLVELSRDLSSKLPDSLVHGALVMAVAAVEVGLSDCLKYYLRHFPEKLPKDYLRNVAEDIPSGIGQHLEGASTRYATALGYKSFPEYVSQFEQLLSIDVRSGNATVVAHLQEVNATRNLLLHNGLAFNEFYAEQAGLKMRSERDRRGRLLVDYDYTLRSMTLMTDFLSACIDAIDEKYTSYTKIRAHRALWRYLFESPVMPYEEFWEVNELKDEIVAMKISDYEPGLSSAERVLLGLWRAHFNGSGEYLKQLNMRSLDRQHRRQLQFVVSIAADFEWY